MYKRAASNNRHPATWTVPMRKLTVVLACGLSLAAATAAAPTTKASPPATTAPRTPGSIDAERMKAAATDPGNWLATGRDQQGTYYSPLTRINTANVSKL